MSDRYKMVNSLTKAIPIVSAIFWGSLFGVQILRLNIQEPSQIVIYSLFVLPLVFFSFFFIIGYLIGLSIRRILTKIFSISTEVHRYFDPDDKEISYLGKNKNSMSSVLATLITITFILSQTPGWLEYFIGYFEFAQQISSLTLIYFIGMPLLLYFSMFFLLFVIFKYAVIVLLLGMVNLRCSINIDNVSSLNDALVLKKSKDGDK